MTSAGHDHNSQECLIDSRANFGHGGLALEDYLLTSTQELDTITQLVGRHETIGRAMHAWMLDQVDFIIETIGNESLELTDEMRSNLLQLLLTIANLNEQIRHQALLGL